MIVEVPPEIVAAARSGDPGAAETLLRVLWPHAFRICRAIARNDTIAEDAAQDACAAVYRNLCTLRADTAFSTWFYRIVVRNASRALKRERREAPFTGLPLSVSIDQRIDVSRALDQIPAAQREVIVLYYYVGLSSRDIGKAIGVPEGTIRFRLFLAKRALRALLVDDTHIHSEVHSYVNETQLRDLIVLDTDAAAVPALDVRAILARAATLPSQTKRRARSLLAIVTLCILPAIAFASVSLSSGEFKRIVVAELAKLHIGVSQRTPFEFETPISLTRARKLAAFRFIEPRGLPLGARLTSIAPTDHARTFMLIYAIPGGKIASASISKRIPGITRLQYPPYDTGRVRYCQLKRRRGSRYTFTVARLDHR